MKDLENYLTETYKLKNVIRYNTRNKIKDESVAEHSFYVALFTLKLCDEYNIDEKYKSQAIIKALLHDMPEIELNDITHNVKERLNLRPFLKQYEDKYFEDNFKDYAELMNNGDKIVNSIVILADAMSVYQYILNEVSLGNKTDDIQEILEESKTRINNLILTLENLLENKGE